MQTMTLFQVEESTKSRTSRNTHPFVLRFPTEILEAIFIHCARDCYYEHHHCVAPAVPCRVKISYVCRHWRSVALACPTFWTYIFIASQQWTEELLARSKQASLKICANFLWNQNISLLLVPLEKAMDNMERVQELRIKLAASCTDQARVISKLSSPAPRLRDLEIMVRDERSLQWPPLLFQGDTPALRTLELCECPPLLHSFKLNALTTLDLFDVPHRFRPSMGEVFSTLRGLPDLKRLHLYRSLASTTDTALETSDKINLPHLSRFSITTSASMVVTFLRCVNIPMNARIKLGCERESWSPNNYEPLNLLLAERYNTVKNQTTSLPTILSLSIDYSEWNSANLTFSTFARHPDPDSDDAWDSDVLLEVDLGLCGEDDNGLVVSSTCRFMPLSNVQFLSVTESPFSETFWESILGYLEEVRYIKLKWGNMPDLCMLSPICLAANGGSNGVQSQDRSAIGGPGQPQRRAFAPRLELLELDGVVFAQEGEPELDEPAITRQRLFEILSNRQGSGRLTMHECEFGDFDVDLVMGWDSGRLRVVSEREYLSDRPDHVDDDDDEMDWVFGWDEGDSEEDDDDEMDEDGEDEDEDEDELEDLGDD